MYISNVLFKKNHNGNWVVAKIFTSNGNFVVSSEISKDLDQNTITAAINDVKEKIIPKIEKFIFDESKPKSKDDEPKPSK